MGLDHAKGAIAPGMDADFAIVDPAARWTVTRDAGVSSAGCSNYEGWELTGRVVHTHVPAGRGGGGVEPPLPQEAFRPRGTPVRRASGVAASIGRWPRGLTMQHLLCCSG